MNTTLNRRHMLRLLAGSAALAATGLAINAGTTSAAGGRFTALRYLDVYAEPSADAEIIGELVAQEPVWDVDAANPEVVNGFRHIMDLEQFTGWVFDEGLVAEDGESEYPEFYDFRFISGADVLLSEPAGGEIVLYMEFADTVALSDQVDNGYIRVLHASTGIIGWMQIALVAPVGTQRYSVWNADGKGVTNVMKKPSLKGKVVTQVWDNFPVLDYDGIVQNGFYGVQHNGYVGWIEGRHLGVG